MHPHLVSRDDRRGGAHLRFGSRSGVGGHTHSEVILRFLDARVSSRHNQFILRDKYLEGLAAYASNVDEALRAL